MAGVNDEYDGSRDGRRNLPTKKRIFPQFSVVLLDGKNIPVKVLTRIFMDYFHKKESSAEIMALGVHETGRGVGGTYTHEVAETKMKQVLYHADRHGHRLHIELEPV